MLPFTTFYLLLTILSNKYSQTQQTQPTIDTIHALFNITSLVDYLEILLQ